ncbi:DUF3429 domain-containing protein [Spongorhabdus nitratireducens]
MTRIPFYSLLALAGTLPFICWVVFRLHHIEYIPYIGHMSIAGTIYTSLIIAFMAGTLWGNSLHVAGRSGKMMLLFSNILALTPWIATLILPLGVYLLATFAICFLLLLGGDWALVRKGQISVNYFMTRLVITTIVVITLVILGVSYGTAA